MRKLLTFLVVFVLAFTIIFSISGKEFKFYDYLISLEELETLNRPELPKIKFKSYTEINENIDYYFFIDYASYMGITDTIGKYENYVVCYWDDDNQIQPQKYTIEQYKEMPDEIKLLMQPHYEFSDDIVGALSSILEFIGQPFVLIYEFLKFVWLYLVYIFNAISIIGGGLIV